MPRPQRWRSWAAFLAAAVALIAVALVPTQTRQGVDYTVSTYSLPLYAKALDFLQRDSSYARLVSQIVSKDAPPESRALTIFEWTRKNIRDTPAGFPVVDDHISHIIIRGYGDDDQKADVFTTLATYAGVPAYWIRIGAMRPFLVLSLVWLDRHWRVFDVQNGIVFRDRRGALVSVEDLIAAPGVITSAAANREYASRPYASYFEAFHPEPAPDLLRAEMQMLWPRTLYRMQRLIGLGCREWQLDR